MRRRGLVCLWVVVMAAIPLGGVAGEQTKQGYCLSGGWRGGYPCDADAPAATATPPQVYSIQLLESADERFLSEREDVLHVVPVADGQRLVYLGRYPSRDRGEQALQRSVATWGMRHRPLLVAVTLRQPMPIIRLVAEPQPTVANPSATQASLAQLDSSSAPASQGLYEQVYAIQVAAYQQPALGQRFSRQHSDIPLLCRLRDNGLFTVYYGVYESAASARLHLQDYPLLSRLGAYVVRMQDVNFEACNSLAERINHSRERAERDRQDSERQQHQWLQHYVPEMTESLLQLSPSAHDS